MIIGLARPAAVTEAVGAETVIMVGGCGAARPVR
jgi:hypothetical protein